MFTSEYYHTIDAKGRVVLPAKLREGLGDRFYITKGNYTDKANRNVRVYTEAAWAEYVDKLRAIPESDKLATKFAKSIIAGTIECEPDKNGRIPIPQNLRTYADLDKDVVSVGYIDRIEIWDKTRWESYNNDDDFDEEALNAALSNYGL